MTAGAYTGLSCNNTGNLVSIGNQYPDATNTLAGFYTCAGGSTTMQDNFVAVAGPLVGIINGSNGFGNNSSSNPLAAGTYDFSPYISTVTPTCGLANLGQDWYNTATSTTVYKKCLNVSGTYTWVTK